MRRHFKKYFIPHEENNHKPHFLCETSVLVLTLVALLVFSLSTFQGLLLLRHTDFLAAVVPSVLIDLTNADRQDNDLERLAPNMTLQMAAQLKANHMAENAYFAHVSPDGVSPWHWFIEAEYRFTHAGENLAVNFIDSEDVEQAWMDSPGHRANILNENFTEIGIATAEGTYQGRKTVFVVQLFGNPATVSIVETEPEAFVAGETNEPDVSTVPIESAEVVDEAVEMEPITSEEILEVLEETDTFISVRTQAGARKDAVAGTDAPGLVEPQSSLFERFATQPHQLLQWLYIFFGAIMLIVLTVTIFVEIEKQHPRNVLYGILLLVLLLVLMYISRNVVFSDLRIV